MFDQVYFYFIKLYFQGSKAGVLFTEVQSRCFHVSPLAAAAAKIAMSKFDTSTYLPYAKLNDNLNIIKKRLDRPLTLSEKVLYSHIDNPKEQVNLRTIIRLGRSWYVHPPFFFFQNLRYHRNNSNFKVIRLYQF